jgi:hypothetical protein
MATSASDFIDAVSSAVPGITLSEGDDGKIVASSSGVQMVGPFPFCLLFLSQQVVTLQIAAPSPEAAASTMDDLIKAANASMPGWTAQTGVCPSGV